MEEVIRIMANLLSVAYHSAVSVSSPYPYVSLFLESQEEKTWVSSASHFHGEHFSYASARHFSVASIDYMAALQDRDDGAAMLAEAISNDHPTAKFREFMRLFERAFALSVSQSEKKLSQFLQGSGLGYDRAEVKRWIDMRDPATHANDLSRSLLVLNTHVLPVMHRMEQAAYDVLLNKKSWATNSRERRDCWRPCVAVLCDGQTTMLTKGKAALFRIQLLDPFGVFGHDESARFNPPADYWATWPPERPLTAAKIEVIEDNATKSIPAGPPMP